MSGNFGCGFTPLCPAGHLPRTGGDRLEEPLCATWLASVEKTVNWSGIR